LYQQRFSIDAQFKNVIEILASTPCALNWGSLS